MAEVKEQHKSASQNQRPRRRETRQETAVVEQRPLTLVQQQPAKRQVARGCHEHVGERQDVRNEEYPYRDADNQRAAPKQRPHAGSRIGVIYRPRIITRRAVTSSTRAAALL